MLTFFTNLNPMEFQVRYLTLFCLFSVIDSFKWLCMGSSQKNVWVILDFFKAPPLVLLNINDLPDDIICNIFVYADDTTLYSKCDQVSDLWRQLELLASELECGL